MSDSMYGRLNDDLTVSPCTANEWAKAFANTNRVIERTRVGNYLISTVFLGLDPNYWTGNTPNWFETAVFDKEMNMTAQTHAPTAEEALQNHRRLCGVAMAADRDMVHQIDERGYSLRAQIRQSILDDDAEHDAGRAIEARLARGFREDRA